MKLKPMDENTLAFLKELIGLYEEAESYGNVSPLNSQIIYLASDFFMTDDFEDTYTLNEFMEAIKNADTHN